MGQDQATISADTTVIDSKAIAQSQAQDVAELLRSQAGIDVASSGGAGKTTSVFLRGGNSGHTLVLIDGVRVGSATTGSFDWANLSTSDIERIEIVRGPQSSLYGADAMAGVIQIFTKTGSRGSQVTLQGEAGSYASSSGVMSVKGKTDTDIAYALTIDSLRTDSVSAAAKGTEPDPYRRTTISASVALPVGRGELALRVRNVDGKTGLDGGFPFGDVVNFTSNTKQTVNSVSLNYPLSDRVETTLQLSRSTDESINHDPATKNNNSDFRTLIDQLTWKNHLDWDAISLLFGVDMYRSKGSSGSAKLNNQLQQSAGFTALSWESAMVDLNGAIRYDRNSIASSKTTYKLGGVLHPLDGVKLTANYGTGFKAPSINDLYFPASAYSAGNPNLKPESSKGWDVGMGYQFHRERMETGITLTWFSQTYKDLIVWAPLPTNSAKWVPSNLNKARTRGLEASANFAYGPAYLQANWTYLDAKDSTTGDWLNRRAKESGNFTAGATLLGLNGEVAWHLVGPRFSGTNNTKPMAGYQKVDVRLHYAVSKRWKLTARVNNAGNKHYEEVSGYGVPGRSWYGGVSTHF